MAEEKQAPPEPMQFVRTSATASTPPPPPLAVQVLDQLGDIVGVVALAWLCSIGRLSGLEAGGLILSLLGVQTGVRKIVGAKGGGGGLPPAGGVGAVALLLLAVFGGHSHSNVAGFARVRTVRVVAAIAALVFAAAIAGCAGQGDSMTQLVSGYGNVRTWAQRICGIVAALPPPPTPSANAPLDGGVGPLP